MKTTEDRYKQFHLRLPVELLFWLRSEAKRQKRSMSAEIVMAVEYWKKTKEELAT